MPKFPAKLPADLEPLEKECRAKGYHIVKLRGISVRKPVEKEGILYDGVSFSLHKEGQYDVSNPHFVSDKATDVKLIRKLGFVE